ncbi:L-aspartate 1-decarboxylase [Clostridium botulinum A2B3 87]|uniref:aspartate 1-decarboxylase n=1 Tax=Clostridium botulinum TaxID=1491 RepID=UPI0004A56842|nr:aspartate 1-decarboxylase [Clostridium botulinum]KEI98777.1 L-aspartate 1-decarboxylase [Clostridium botulinum A2B3 87]MBN3346608.1 aspartate 1-decarboxylase [Clostridium botulinum]
MILNMLKSKIHRATVTEANLNYVGSITIDRMLLDAAEIMPGEKVQIVDNNNGARLETYVIEGAAYSGIICLNGAAARLVQPGDTVIIIAYCYLNPSEAATFRPKVIFLNENNEIVDKSNIELHGDIR